MKLLLDTHIYLWWLEDPGLLADEARIAIANPRTSCSSAPVSIIEISIKQSSGKLRTDEPPEDQLAACRFHELPLTFTHAAALRDLPFLHKDLFDRMLTAQARVEGLTLITRDAIVRQYDVPSIAA